MKRPKRKYREFKLYEDVVILDGEKVGYVDAITPDHRYVVRLPGTYEWCYWYDMLPVKEFEEWKKNKTITAHRFDYL